MSAPTATAATLIRTYRDATEFAELAAAEADTAAADHARDEHRAVAAALTNLGLGWVAIWLAAERRQPTRVNTARVNAVLARCA